MYFKGLNVLFHPMNLRKLISGTEKMHKSGCVLIFLFMKNQQLMALHFDKLDAN